MKRRIRDALALALALLVMGQTGVHAQKKASKPSKPNILIIWGDDIGEFNISAYNMGMMGYKTPNIDGSPRRARCSPTGTVSRAAPPGVRRSSPASRRSAPA